MAATTTDRDTQERYLPSGERHQFLGTDSTQYLKGEMVALDTDTGKLVKVTQAGTNLLIIGRCEENYLTGTSNTYRVKCKSGRFKWANGDTIVAADIGKPCFGFDNQTVKKTAASGGAYAGVIYDVDTDGVWVTHTWPNTGLPASTSA